MEDGFKYKLFNDLEKAIKFKESKANSFLYNYNEGGDSRSLYIAELRAHEGVFDEELAFLFPYCVSWIE